MAACPLADLLPCFVYGGCCLTVCFVYLYFNLQVDKSFEAINDVLV